MVMVQRQKRYLYRIVRDPKTGSDSLMKYPMESGLAGYCTVAGHTILVENIKGDVRFV